MPTSDEYRERAAHSAKLAAESLEPNEKAMLLKLAQQWALLAEYKEKVPKRKRP